MKNQPTKERKELVVGETFGEALKSFEATGRKFDETKHDIEQDGVTGLWSIYHKRKNHDRTIKRSITRETRDDYTHGYGKDRRRVGIRLTPREYVEVWLKGTRRVYRISIHDLHKDLAWRYALAMVRARNLEKANRRKAAKAARKAARKKG